MAQDIQSKIREAALARGISPDTALTIANIESSGNPSAKNPRSSARGLFQVIDSTWKAYGGDPKKRFDVDENIRVGMDVLKDNTDYLKRTLERDPSATELYAAHFFGPATATKVLGADPATPISSLVSKKVMQSNPELKNSSVSDFIGRVSAKFGAGKGRPAPKGASPMQTPPPAPGVKPVGNRFPMQMSEMPDGYKAALALSYLDDAGEEDLSEKTVDGESKLSVGEQYLADTAPVQRASLDLTVANPFDALEPQQPVQNFAFGGIANPTAAYIPTTAMRDWENYVNLTNDYIKQKEAYDAALKKQWIGMKPVSTYMPAQGGVMYQIGGKEYYGTDALRKMPNVVVGTNWTAAGYPAWERIPNTDPDVVAALANKPGAQVLPPGLTTAQYNSMSQAQFDKYIDDRSDVFNTDAAAAERDQQNRQLALEVAADPAKYNLSMPKILAEGGEVSEDAPDLMDVSDYATRRSEEMFPGMAGQDDPRDAARHLLAAGTVARKYGPMAAELLGKAHEYTGSLQTAASLFGIGEPRGDFPYDVHNNEIGIKLGQQATSQAQLEELVKQMAQQSSFDQTPGRPWIMSQEAMDARADEARARMERPPEGYAKGGDVQELDLDAEEAKAFASKNVTKTRNPDNPSQIIPNAARSRVGQELIQFLRDAQAVPALRQAKGTPQAYEGPAYFSSPSTPEDPGYIRFPSFAQDPYNDLVHELTHAADRPMRIEHKRLLDKVAKQEPLTPEEQRYLSNYEKLYIAPTNLPLSVTEPQVTEKMRKYRTGADELRAFGVSNMAQSAPNPDMYSRVDIGATLNPHVDPTMAQESAIMRDLYLRRNDPVRKRAEGSPPEGEGFSLESAKAELQDLTKLLAEYDVAPADIFAAFKKQCRHPPCSIQAI